MSSQVPDRYRPQQQHQKRNQRHHNHHQHNNQQQHQQPQQQQQPHQQQQQQQQTEFFNSNGNVNRFFSTERNNGSRYIHSNGNGNTNVAATDGHSNNHNHNASVFEPIRIIQKDIKNKYSNNKSSVQASNKKSVSPSPSVASSGSSTNSSTNSGTNKNGNKNNNNSSSNNNNSNNRNSKLYNGNSMQSMNTHRINVNINTNTNTNTNTSTNTNIPTTPLNIQQSRFSNRLRYMDQPKSHQFGEQPNARPNNLLGTIDGFNIYPSQIKPNFAPSVPQQKVRSGLSGNFMAVNARKFFYDVIKFREMRYRARMSEIPMPIDLFNGTEWDSLSQKIWAKFEQKRQTRDTFEKKMLLWNQLRKVVEMLYGGQKCLYMVGSTISGFALDSSDVDMCIVSRLGTTLPEPRYEPFIVLNRLQTYLQENCQNFSQNLNYIPARVPILRFDHPENNIEVDLNYNNCVTIRNSHLLYCYTLLDWRLQPLALIVKLWAQHHDINNAKDLTISSYSLILMVINYLQCGVQPPILPCLHAKYPEQFGKIHDIDQVEIMDVGMFSTSTDSSNKQTLGELFVGFLQYYSNFKFERFAISVRAGHILPIEECRNYKNEGEWRQLCIEEPFNRSNAARSCCDERIFERIKKIFTKSWHLLQDTKDLDQLFSDEILEPPAHAYYDSNFSQILYHPMDYFMR